MTTESKHNGKRRPSPKQLLGRFGPYLQSRRKQKKLSIRGFAQRAKLPHSNIFQFENLRKDPRLTELSQLARAFGEGVDQFIAPLF